MIGLSTEELTKNSEIVIRGEVENVEPQWSKDGSIIFSRAVIIINDVVAGDVAENKIIVEYEGGEMEDIGFRVSDVSPLVKGDHVILFLKSGESKRDGFVRNIVGKNQGKYIIGKDGIARKSGFSIVGGENLIDNNVPMDALINKIRSVKK
jgi:hypothetical protein